MPQLTVVCFYYKHKKKKRRGEMCFDNVFSCLYHLNLNNLVLMNGEEMNFHFVNFVMIKLRNFYRKKNREKYC